MRVEVNGSRIFFEGIGRKLRGEGMTLVERPTILILHGGPGWDHYASVEEFAPLADDYQLIFYDHRGQGRSDGWGDVENQTLNQWGDEVKVFCDALDIRKPVVLGTSFGGMVAQSYAIRHPGHAAGLVLNTTAAKFDIDLVCDAFLRVEGEREAAIAREALVKATPEAVEQYFEHCLPKYQLTPSSPEKKARITYNNDVTLRFVHPGGEGRIFDFTSQLKSVQCPVLVLAGEDDPITPPECSKIIADAIGDNAELHIVEHCRHAVIQERPDIGFPLLRDFVSRLEFE